MIEQIIGNYRIVGEIGAGGMASVHLAVHKDVPNLKVVLKRLSDRSLVDRFKREADKLALLDGQAGICQIKHFFDHGGDFFIAMEYIDGCNLDETVRGETGLDHDGALSIMSAVLRTLEFAHSRGIYHRDIKPTNIMIDTGGQVKVIDFGIAKGKSDPDLTTVGTSLGSPRYMAPEQFAPDENTDWARCDIYAVGVTLYYALTAQLPFSGKDLYELREEKYRGLLEAPSRVDPTVSPAMDAVVMRALVVDPAQRYGSAAEMLVDLTAAAAGEPVHPLPPPPSGDPGHTRVMDAVPPPRPVATARPAPPVSRPSVETVPLWRRFPPAVLAGAAALVLVLVVGGIWLGTRGGDGPAVQPGPGDDLGDGRTDTTVRDVAPVPPEPGVVDVSIRPGGGSLWVDGELVGHDLKARRITLDAGAHTLRAEQPDSREASLSRTIEVAAGARSSEVFTFTHRPAPVPAAQGELLVGSRPSFGHDIYIDGKKMGKPTQARFFLSTGLHVVKVVAIIDGVAVSKEKQVTVVEGENEKLFFDFD